MRVYVATSQYGIERDFLDALARSLGKLGHQVSRDRPRGAGLSVVWGTRGHEGVGWPRLYCELGWLPRWQYQVSPAGINADHHLAAPELHEPTPSQAAVIETRLRRIRDARSPYRYMETDGSPAQNVPGGFILCPLQVESDTNMVHVPEGLRTADGLIDELSAWDPPYPIIFKAHPSSFARGQKYVKPRRRKDLVRLHQQGNIHSYLKHPACQLVVTLNSNTAHDALLWDIPVVALGRGFWPESGPFYPRLPPELTTFWEWARSERTRLLRLAYAEHVMDSQWSVEDASDIERVRRVVELACGGV